MTQKRKLLIYVSCTLILFCATWLLHSTLERYGIWLTLDSLRYLETAENVRDGRGLVLGHYLLIGQAQPLTAWPPLYPVFLSVFLRQDSSILYQTILPNLLLYLLSGLFLFLTLKRLVGASWALAGCSVWLVSVHAWTVYHYAWSETLFIPLSLAGIWMLVELLTACKRCYSTVAIMMGVTFIIIALFYTRYIGGIFVVFLGLAWLLKSKYNQCRFYPGFLIIAGSFFCGAVSIWIWRNLTLTGDTSGIRRLPSDIPLFDNILSSVTALLVFIPQDLVIHGIALMIALFVVLIQVNKKQKNSEETHTGYLGLWLGIITASAYLVALISMRSWKEFDDIDVRLVAPAVPFLVLAFVSAGYLFSKMLSKSALVNLFFVVWILSSIFLEGVRVYHEAYSKLYNKEIFAFKSQIDAAYVNLSVTHLPYFNALGQLCAQLDPSGKEAFIIDTVDAKGDQRLASLIHLGLNRKIKLFPDMLDDNTLSALNRTGKGFLVLAKKSSIRTLKNYYQEQFIQLKFEQGYLQQGFFVTTLPLPAK